MNTLSQRTIIKHSPLNSVKTKNNNILSVKQNASIVKKIALHGLQLIMNFSLYFPMTFVWFTVAFALSGNLAISYPIEPDAIYLTFDNVANLLVPVFRLSLAVTLIICLLRHAVGVFQRKSSKKESTSC